MTIITLTTGEKCETGLVLDGHYGWLNHYRLVREVAQPLGFRLDSEDIDLVDAYAQGNDITEDGNASELVSDLMDEAEAYLNSITPDDYLWHWHDGEFFLSPYCTVDPDSGEACEFGSGGGDCDCDCACHLN